MRINHLLILANDMPAMYDFFIDVIGLEDGTRPPFPFPGHWLYSDGEPLIHLAQRDGDAGRVAYLGVAHGTDAGTGVIDHLALIGADYPTFVARLKRLGAAHSVRHIPAERQVQIFVPGPEGVKIEMLFPEATFSQS